MSAAAGGDKPLLLPLQPGPFLQAPALAGPLPKPGTDSREQHGPTPSGAALGHVAMQMTSQASLEAGPPRASQSFLPER